MNAKKGKEGGKKRRIIQEWKGRRKMKEVEEGKRVNGRVSLHSLPGDVSRNVYRVKEMIA